MLPEQQNPQEWQDIIERGARCALRDDNARWDWADLALDVAGAPGDDHAGNGSGEILDKLIADVAADAHVGISELPTNHTLRNYREAADSLPPGEHRAGCGVSAARELRRHYKDRATRYAVVAELRAASPKDRVTVDDVRTRAGVKTTRPRPKVKEYSKLAVELHAAYVCMHEAAELAYANEVDDSDSYFAHKMLAKVELEIERVRDNVPQPDSVRDIDAEFAGLLGGDAK